MISFRFFFFLTEFDFSLLRSYVGVENSYHCLNQSDNKVTPTATWLFAFSRAKSSLFIYILNFPQVCNICLFPDWKLRLIPALAYLRRRILIYFEPHHKVRQWHQIWLFRYQTSSEGFFPNRKKNWDYLTWTTLALSQMKDDGKKMNDHNKIINIWRWKWWQKEGGWKSILETHSEMETQKGTMMFLSNSLLPSKNTNGVLWDQQQGVDSHRKGLLRYENTKRNLQLCKRSK